MADRRLDRLDAWLSTHHGVVTRRNLIADLGFSPSQATRVVGLQRLVPMARGVYRSPAHPLGPMQLMAAACLIQEEAAVSHTTAGRLWGFRGMAGDDVHILVPHGRTLALDGVIVHRCRRIDPVDLAGRGADGIRLTSPPRTVLDSAELIGPRRTESVVEQVLAEERFKLTTLFATMRRLRHSRRPGSLVLSRVLLGRPEWRGAARSDLEIFVREAIERHGLTGFEVNLPVELPGGRTVVLDLAWPLHRVAVEVDHPFWHDGVVEAARDKVRDLDLAMLGWQTVRFPELEIGRDIDGLVARLAAVLALRAPAA